MKQIIEELEAWRKERGMFNFELNIKDSIKDEIQEAITALKLNDMDNFAEEVADVSIFCFNGIGQLGMDYTEIPHGYHKTSLECLESLTDNISIQTPVTTCQILLMSISLCKDIVTKAGYDFKKVVLEKIKVLSSRVQDSVQMEEWKLSGAKGKWLKSKEQDKSTLYIADYSSCKL